MKNRRIIIRVLSLMVAVLFVCIGSLSVSAVSGFGQATDKYGDESSFVSTQFPRATYENSWLKELVVKEYILSAAGTIPRCDMKPVTSYPYFHKPDTFSDEVNYYVEFYTLDENAQKAAYLYLFKQLDALTVISDPTTTDASKIAWLEKQGIVMPDDIDSNSTAKLMANALYALMKNDAYYVITGEKDVINIPEGTPLEEALMTYVVALFGNNTELMGFLSKNLDVGSITTLDEYVFYTSLYALFLNGKVSISELKTITPDEVNRRMAIWAIEDYGISIDAKTASDEEIRLKYITASLGEQYQVRTTPEALQSALSSNYVPFYILQLMAKQDAGISIPRSNYNYNDAFDIVRSETSRFDLEDDFYSDLFEYDIHLDYRRSCFYVRATPIYTGGTDGASLKLSFEDGTACANDSYTEVALKGSGKTSVTLVVKYLVHGIVKSTSRYKLNVYNGTAEPESQVNFTDLATSPIITGMGSTRYLNPSDVYALLAHLASSPDGSNLAMSDILAQVYSTDENGNYIDPDGNVIMLSEPETIPEGYELVTYADGSYEILPIANNSANDSTPAQTDGTPREGGAFGFLSKYFDDAEALLVLVCAVIVFALLMILAVVLILRRKKARADEPKTTLAQRVESVKLFTGKVKSKIKEKKKPEKRV